MLTLHLGAYKTFNRPEMCTLPLNASACLGLKGQADRWMIWIISLPILQQAIKKWNCSALVETTHLKGVMKVFRIDRLSFNCIFMLIIVKSYLSVDHTLQFQAVEQISTFVFV